MFFSHSFVLDTLIEPDMADNNKQLFPIPEVNQFFSREDIGGVNEQIFQAQLELATLKLKIAQFENTLFLASMQESKEGLEAEYWLQKFKESFNVKK